jgi:predicted ATPase
MNGATQDHSGYGLMIESVEFRNFKVLRSTRLPLAWFTLLVGPNGSGKTTAIQALEAVSQRQHLRPERFASAGSDVGKVEVILRWRRESEGSVVMDEGLVTKSRGYANRHEFMFETEEGQKLEESHPIVQPAVAKLRRIRTYSLEAKAIAAPAPVRPEIELASDGRNLAAVLDQIQGHSPEHFDALNEELGRWLPEFDRIVFDIPEPGAKLLQLRARQGKHKIGAQDLSQGTLIALALLTIAYLPDPPSLVCLEEPDRGLHPRLLRRVRDALYRLSYPQKFGESREPVQVLATTHSPYFLDLFREYPEEVVIAQRVGTDAVFEPLSERRDIEEILEGTHLGEAWYSGVLGGVPPEE